MSFEDERRPGPMPVLDVPRRRSPFAIAAIVVSIVVFIGIVIANVWTEYAWYNQVGYTTIWTTQWVARVILFTVFGGIAAFGGFQDHSRPSPISFPERAQKLPPLGLNLAAGVP